MISHEDLKKLDTLSEGGHIDHPSHYNQGRYEAIDVIADWTKDCNSIEAFDIGNALKYLCRWKSKGGVEDLKKAVWYIQHCIAFEEEVHHDTV